MRLSVLSNPSPHSNQRPRKGAHHSLQAPNEKWRLEVMTVRQNGTISPSQESEKIRFWLIKCCVCKVCHILKNSLEIELFEFLREKNFKPNFEASWYDWKKYIINYLSKIRCKWITFSRFSLHFEKSAKNRIHDEWFSSSYCIRKLQSLI